MKELAIERHVSEADLGAFFRPQDAEAVGIGYRQRRHLEGMGLVQREGWGLYRKTEADITWHHTIAAVCARVPQGVVCLLSALEVYEIGTQKAHEIWIAIPRKVRVPALGRLPGLITRLSARTVTYGVVAAEFEGVAAKITTPARTVVDCFRFRSKVGLEPAIEAFHAVLDDRKATSGEIRRAAEECGALSLLGPALRMRTR